MFKNYIKFFSIIILIFFSQFSILFSQTSGWIDLLDPKLSSWETYLSYRHLNDFNGKIPTDASGNIIQPIGYNNDDSNVFSISMEKNIPVLRISGEIYGCIFTKNEYENYHLKLKVKWGNKKWTPRTDKLRDSGILYHSVGECGKDYWQSWMLSQEFQIMEGHMGDYWNIANSAVDIRAFTSEGNINPIASTSQDFIPIGSNSKIGGFCLREADYESKSGEWTDLELICFSDQSLYIVNGHVVMVLKNSRIMEDGKAIKLTKGKIQLQSEAAEVFFKEIKIKLLEKMPTEYKSYFETK